jgi:pimeloyl-ACP methyl ester carboxylesterase
MPYIRAGDLNMHYIEQGQGESVLLVHGNWTTSSSWLPVLERLPAGLRGIAPDMRGRGATEGSNSSYTIPELAQDLRAFAGALDLESFHLVGHSLGSAVAMQFALESPERVLSLTVLSPAWVDGMPEAYNVPAAQQALRDDKELFARALKLMMPTLPEGDLWQQLVDEGHKQRIEATLANLTALIEWKPGDRLGDLGVPTLVVSGGLDPLTGGENANRAAQALRAEEVVIPGAGHSPNIEAPDRFVELLSRHINAHRSTQSTNERYNNA